MLIVVVRVAVGGVVRVPVLCVVVIVVVSVFVYILALFVMFVVVSMAMVVFVIMTMTMMIMSFDISTSFFNPESRHTVACYSSETTHFTQNIAYPELDIGWYGEKQFLSAAHDERQAGSDDEASNDE